MKALTIKQPWAQLIMLAGKDVENREWPTSFRGHVAITASAKIDKAEIFSACEFMRGFIRKFSTSIFLHEAMGYPHGCVLGTVEVYDCVQHHPSPWFCGSYGFLLRNPRMLSNPIPVKGSLGFWDLPENIEQMVASELGDHH